MNTIFFKRTSFLLSLATSAVVSSGLSAQAQTIDATAADVKTEPTPDTKAVTSASRLMTESSAPVVAQADGTVVPGGTTPSSDQTAPSTFQDGTTPGSDQTAPGTFQDGTDPGTVPGTTPTTPGTGVVAPGRATRSGPSYIGVGGNIGFGGDTTLSEGAFSVFSKIGLTNTLSARPAALIGDNAVFLIPITFDFPTADVGELGFSPAPYLGGGVAISTGRDSTVGALITGGVDVPLSPQFTATAGVNVGFIDQTEVGLLLGVGYNF